ncbi:hypothetical protein RE069_004039 [Klebsiella aerogenes]|nr:hypothetical protein [Klebsiella aerogenes]
MEELIIVPHLGLEFLVRRYKGRFSTSILPICDALSLSPAAELARLRATPAFEGQVVEFEHLGQTHYLFPVCLLVGWLVLLDAEMPEDKIPLLRQLQTTAAIKIWKTFFAVFFNPSRYPTGNPGDYKSRNFIYNCPANAVREIEVEAAAPVDLAIAALQQFSQYFATPGADL